MFKDGSRIYFFPSIKTLAKAEKIIVTIKNNLKGDARKMPVLLQHPRSILKDLKQLVKVFIQLYILSWYRMYGIITLKFIFHYTDSHIK